MPNETRTYRRSELYEQVWAEPVREVAKRYGVSDVALAKTCRKLAVPLPGVGYWTRKRAGRKMRQTPLPPLPEGVAEETALQMWVPDEPTPVPLSPETEAIVAEVQNPEATIVVPDSLNDPHRLVAKADRLLRNAKPSEGVVRCWKRRCLDIVVAPESLDRALRIFDALIKALEKRGLLVEITDPPTFDAQGYRLPSAGKDPENATRTRVADEWLRIDLVEKQVPVRNKPESPSAISSTFQTDHWSRRRRLERAPNGVLMLRILDLDHLPGRTAWKDGRRARVENSLNDFIAGLYVKAEAVKQARVESERRRREYEEEERRRWEAQQLAWKEEARLKKYQEMLARWRLARDIREFTQEASDMVASAQCTIRPGEWVDELLTWGEAYAEEIDPLTPLAEELAAHIAKRQATSAPPQSSDSQPSDPS